MSEPVEERPRRWVQRIAKWMAAAESRIPEPEFLKGKYPEWVNRVARELMYTFFPEAQFKVGRLWSPKEIGAIMGHQLAYWHGISEVPKLRPIRGFRKIDKKTRARITRQVERSCKEKQQAIERALTLASKQAYSDATEFFTAFANALNRKPSDIDASNFHRTNTRIYWLMLLCWRSVERLRSVHELQQALCRHFEPHTVGSVKRIEKMCQRLGLKFGPRGRPKRLVDRERINQNSG